MATLVVRRSWLLFIGIFLVLVLLVILSPHQSIDPDSVFGFRALQGWKATGQFNQVITPDTADISRFHSFFLTWWSPGQYLFPYFVQRVFHLSLGRCVTWLNFFAMLGGLAGFYKLFRFYQFPEKVAMLSVLLILFSQTVLFRFILYQGGETYSFLFFPWLVYVFVRVKNRWVQAGLAVVLIVAGFVAKSQMLIALIPLFLLAPMVADRGEWRSVRRLVVNVLPVGIAVVVAVGLLQVLFLSKGVNPSTTAQFNPSLLDTFMPLASPINALSNAWSLVYRIGERYPVAEVFVLVIFTGFVFFVFIKAGLQSYYTRLVFFYYLACGGIFIVLYYFDAHIDYDVRHHKFMAYMFFPVLVNFLRVSFSYRKVAIGIVVLAVYALVNQYRLTRIWNKDIYVTKGDFALSRVDLPEELYRVLRDQKTKGLTLFFSEFPAKWAIDRWDIVYADSRRYKVCPGNKYAVWYVKKDMPGWEQEIHAVFPAYSIASTRKVGDYWFIQLR